MVSEKQLDDAMKYLHEHHEKEPGSLGVREEVFESDIKDSKMVLEALQSDGYVEKRRGSVRLFNSIIKSFDCIALTDKGKLYFIEKKRKQRISRRQFGQSFAIAVISAVVSTILTLFVSQRSEESETSSSQV